MTRTAVLAIIFATACTDPPDEPADPGTCYGTAAELSCPFPAADYNHRPLGFPCSGDGQCVDGTVCQVVDGALTRICTMSCTLASISSTLKECAGGDGVCRLGKGEDGGDVPVCWRECSTDQNWPCPKGTPEMHLGGCYCFVAPEGDDE